jgi:hypothetical protein
MRQDQLTLTRRNMLKGMGAAAGAAIGFPYIIPSNVLAAPGRPGANDKITLAHIGVGGMGGFHLGAMVGYMKKGVVNIAAVCDCDDARLTNASATAGPQADVYRDYRYVLERKDIDAVIIATPDH